MAREDPSSILPAWQEFCGFDLEGENGWFDIGFDEETGTATFRKAKDAPFGFRHQLERLKMILDPAEAKKAGPWKEWLPAGDGVYQAKVSWIE